MKPAKEIRVGNIIMVDSKPMIVLRSDVNGSSRTGFTYKWKMKNLLTNSPLENVFRGDDKFDVVVLDKKPVTYSYFADPLYVFMDTEYNQYEIDAESLSDIEKYLSPDMTDICEVTFYEGRPISVVLPQTIIREVEYTEPVARGDTSGKITKSAILKDTKHDLQVSSFVEIGDKIEIDTVTGEFKRRCT